MVRYEWNTIMQDSQNKKNLLVWINLTSYSQQMPITGAGQGINVSFPLTSAQSSVKEKTPPPECCTIKRAKNTSTFYLRYIFRIEQTNNITPQKPYSPLNALSTIWSQ